MLPRQKPKTVLCYGDSNIWGAVPMSSWAVQPRFEPSARWTGVLEAELGLDWRVIAEGLPGRTTILKDPIDGDHLSGLTYLKPCLDSHKPIDVIVLALGTNDFKRRFGMEAEDVADGVERLLVEIEQVLAPAQQQPKIVLICPPPVRAVGIFTTTFSGAEEKFPALPGLLQRLADERGAAFLDLGGLVENSPVDGIHLTAESHRLVGEAVAPIVRLLG